MGTAVMTRPRHRLVGGVCAGFAEHTGLPVAAVRTATVILAACGGAGVLLYAWLWALTPTAGASDAPLPLQAYLSRTGGGGSAGGTGPDAATDAVAGDARRAPVTEILLGIALLAAGIALVASRLGVGVPLDAVIPVVVVLAGTGLAWGQFADLRRGGPTRSSAPLVRILGALVLVVLGILLFFIMGDRPNGWTVVIAALAVLLGVAVVVAPWALRLMGDLADERSARLREADRAEIAAHLHDSVLQTLALIQQQAGPASEASRLARAQERDRIRPSRPHRGRDGRRFDGGPGAAARRRAGSDAQRRTTCGRRHLRLPRDLAVRAPPLRDRPRPWLRARRGAGRPARRAGVHHRAHAQDRRDR
jgi:phage shock protein PspC (stress-responsive transcriptional regulator)